MRITKEKILWYIISVEFLVILISGLGTLLHWPFVQSFIFAVVMPATVPILLLILHACWTLNFRRGLFLLMLAGCTGLFFEVIGLKYGRFFGGPYAYHSTVSLIYGVPFLVVLYWALFVYTGYAITTSFLYWLQKDKPNKYNHQVFLLLALIASDGIIVTAIDLFMDPIQARAGAWTWLQGGAYFGVPLGNFVGWFVVAVIVTGIFRLFEYFRPQQARTISKSVFLIPVVGYIALAFLYALNAIHLGLYRLTAIGLCTMLFIAGLNLFFYSKQKNETIID